MAYIPIHVIQTELCGGCLIVVSHLRAFEHLQLVQFYHIYMQRIHGLCRFYMMIMTLAGQSEYQVRTHRHPPLLQGVHSFARCAKRVSTMHALEHLVINRFYAQLHHDECLRREPLQIIEPIICQAVGPRGYHHPLHTVALQSGFYQLTPMGQRAISVCARLEICQIAHITPRAIFAHEKCLSTFQLFEHVAPILAAFWHKTAGIAKVAAAAGYRAIAHRTSVGYINRQLLHLAIEVLFQKV